MRKTHLNCRGRDGYSGMVTKLMRLGGGQFLRVEELEWTSLRTAPAPSQAMAGGGRAARAAARTGRRRRLPPAQPPRPPRAATTSRADVTRRAPAP